MSLFRKGRFWRLLPALFAPAALGAEAPVFDVSIQSLQNIYTATTATSSVAGFKPHINFPYMKQRADGTLEVTYTVGQTHGAGIFGMRAYSYDGGMTWSGHTTTPPSTPNSSIVRPVGQMSYGVAMAFSDSGGRTSWSNGRYTSSNGGLSWSVGPSYWNTGSISYVSAYNNLGDMIQAGGMLMTTAYLTRKGSSTSEHVLFASTDNGVNWTRRSTIAGYIGGPNVSMGSEGANEGSVVQLNNGNLLSVYRTGQPFPTSDPYASSPSLFWSMSSDLGLTWTTPKMLGVTGVFPLLRKLDDGSVALTTGRYGAKVMFADETGLRWTTPTIIYDGPSSGHTEMRRRSDGKYVFVYDQSSFYPPSWDASPPAGYVYDNNQSANLKAAILSIQRQPVTDDYQWASEYHGDVTPDTLAQPWTASLSGSPSAYLWAEQGQDYLRIATGASGSSNSLYYSLSGDGTAWAGMDYSDGVVLDIRGRVSGSTAEGAADLVAGDGVNGYFALELTGTRVLLEGQGGNASQAAYAESAHPGFATESWHTYRVIVAPDPEAGGAILAKVYLDGSYAEPIMSTALNPAQLDQLYFGDVTGTSNGTFDIDFVRFASLVGQWSADANGNWSQPGNWSAGVPDSIDATARFADAITSARTVTVDAPVTVGHILFDNANRYSVVGPGTITLRVGSGNADITLTKGDHTISAPLSLVSNTEIIGPGALTAGNISNAAGLRVRTDVTAGNVDGAGSTSVAAGAALSAARVRQSALNIDGSVVVLPGGGNGSVSRVNALSIAGTPAAPAGVLDLSDNDLVIDYASASPLADVRQWIKAGAATGQGIVSTFGGAANRLGYGEAAALSTSVFSGQSVDATSLLIKFTYAGDANLDGKVDVGDLGMLATNWQGPAYWTGGDFDYDGLVNVADLGILATNWQLGVGSPLGPSFDEALASLGLPAVAVPEPAQLASAVLVALIAMRRRAQPHGMPLSR